MQCYIFFVFAHQKSDMGWYAILVPFTTSYNGNGNNCVPLSGNESLLKVMHGINMTLNKTNCDWFLYMSVMWPIGQSLAKKKRPWSPDLLKI